VGGGGGGESDSECCERRGGFGIFEEFRHKIKDVACLERVSWVLPHSYDLTNDVKRFKSVIYDCAFQARVFVVPGRLFELCW